MEKVRKVLIYFWHVILDFNLQYMWVFLNMIYDVRKVELADTKIFKKQSKLIQAAVFWGFFSTVDLQAEKKLNPS